MLVRVADEIDYTHLRLMQYVIMYLLRFFFSFKPFINRYFWRKSLASFKEHNGLAHLPFMFC